MKLLELLSCFRLVQQKFQHVQLPVNCSNVTRVLPMRVLFGDLKVAAPHQHLHHLQAARNEMKSLQIFIRWVHLPASENCHMENVRFIVVDGKVQVRFEAAQVDKKRYILVIDRLKELKL